MQFLLDNIAAVLIGSVLLLILLAAGARVSEAETETQLYELARRQSQALAQQLEGDLLNVGYGVPTTADIIEEWTDSTFSFRRRADTTAAAPVILVSYQRQTVGSVDVEGVATPIYRVQRVQDGAPDGGSPSTLTLFEIDLIERDGTPTTTIADAIGVRVAFKTSFGTNHAQALNSTRYERAFYPSNLDNPSTTP